MPALLRRPLLWTATAAFVGGAVGLIGTIRQATLWDSYDYDPEAVLYAAVAQASGEALVALSLLGVPAMLRSRTAGRVAAIVGGAPLLLLLGALTVSIYYGWSQLSGDGLDNVEPPPLLFRASFVAAPFLGSVVALPFAVAAFARRQVRLGALLAGLLVSSFPFGVASILLNPNTFYEPSMAHWLLGFFGWGVGLLEVPLWALLGVALFREARERAYGEAEVSEARGNREKAARLYQEGLGRGDPSAVEDLVSESFRDLRRPGGPRGKPGMGRIFSDLRGSFPDLMVRLEGQETEADLVRTRLLLSGTDRGGVLWYPPTGRHAAFSAEFVDRFSGGKVVEHGGETDTEDLLRQLGLPSREGTPARAKPVARTAQRGPYAPPSDGADSGA